MNVGEGETACYWLEANGLARIGLRRFTYAPIDGEDRPDRVACPAGGGHDGDALTEIEMRTRFETLADGVQVLAALADDELPDRRSSAWPRRCQKCDERFPRGAVWQAYQAQGYVRADTGETVWTRHVRGTDFAGALVDEAWWLATWPFANAIGPDGIGLVAVCPNGLEWRVDGEAIDGGRWTRTGDPRQPATLTVTPSIVAGDYHGYLQAGRFTAHIG